MIVINAQPGASPRMQVGNLQSTLNLTMCMVESKHWALLSMPNITVNLRGISPYVSSYEGLAAPLTAVKVRLAGQISVLPSGHASFNMESDAVNAPVVHVRFRENCYDDSQCELCIETPFTAATMASIPGSAALILPGIPGACIKFIFELALLAQNAGARYVIFVTFARLYLQHTREFFVRLTTLQSGADRGCR